MDRITAPMIYLISCKRDTHRRGRALASIAAQGAPVTVIDAVDARGGLGVFQDHLGMVPDRFWGREDIKPGALGCFISHRLAWQAFYASGADHAVFMEDDSRLDRLPMPSDADLTFVNDRMVNWADAVGIFEPAELMRGGLKDPSAASWPKTAPGGDGYILSRSGAGVLIEQSSKDRALCGVDWYLLAASGTEGWGDLHPQAEEPLILSKTLGLRSTILSATIAQKAQIKNDRRGRSSIGHSNYRKIEEIKTFGLN